MIDDGLGLMSVPVCASLLKGKVISKTDIVMDGNFGGITDSVVTSDNVVDR